MAAPVRRELPPRPDLAQQKAQAKELLKGFLDGDAEAVARVRAALPDKTRIVLADAQFVIAREYGFRDWGSLKQHLLDRLAAARAPHEQLHVAMQRRDAATVRELLARHAEFRPLINAPLFAFNSPAIVSCAHDAAMVEVLLEFGADPNAKSQWWAGGFHALYSATGVAAERLLAAGAIPDACAAAHLDDATLLTSMLTADPTRVAERGGDGQTPLHFARSRRVIDLLLEHGADINARDVDHRASPAEWMLDRARGAGRYELAQYLVERGAAVDIFLAAALGRTDDARAMVRRDPALLDAQTARGAYAEVPPSSFHIYFWTIGANRSPLEVAAQFGHDETVAALRELATPMQQLRLACRIADAHSARALVRAHPQLVPSLAANDQRAITDAAWDGNTPAVALMLELGFDPATPGHDAGTALHCAAWQGAADAVQVMLSTAAGRALLTQKDAHHANTPLGWCCHGSLHGPRHGDFVSVARQLLEAGAPRELFDASDEVESLLSDWAQRDAP